MDPKKSSAGQPESDPPSALKLGLPRPQSFIIAVKGLDAAWSTSRNFRFHICAGASGAIGLGISFGISPIEWMFVVFSIGLVTSAEGFNSALETLADAVHPAHDPLVGRAKDMAAGAVLLAAATAASVGLLIFVPRIWHWAVDL